jgi:hypothetical protein
MVDTVIVEAEAPAVSAVSWPAIIAGGFTAAAFTLLLLALGAGRSELAGEDRQYLTQMVAARTGLAPAEAQRRVAAVEADARAALNQARRIAMQLSFWLVAAMFLGAFAAGLAATEGGAARDGR